MSLLASAAYDPAVAVSKALSARLAMTALDTANLRVTFTAPANGIVMVRLKGQTAAVTTSPRIHLGVLDGATLRGRATPEGGFSTNSATTSLGVDTKYLVTGLTPGNSYTWDAAYGVDVLVASAVLRYGGPNDAAGADAFGAFVFEVWSTENLLAGTFYDPLVSVTKSTTALLAMTAFDTANLRLTFTTPPSGNVFWRVQNQLHGATGGNSGSTLLGILEGATVVARETPTIQWSSTAVTSCGLCEASGVVSGLPAGSHTWDAAYAVQTVASAGGFAYGGPDDTTTDNCFGGAAFEVWAA